MGNGLDEFLGGGTGYGVVLDDLRSSRARDAKRFAFTGKLRNEADGLGTRSVDGSSGKEQIADESIAKIAFQARDTAEAGDESQAQFGKRKPRHFVGDDHVAGQGQLKSSTKTSAMNGGDGDKGRGIDRVQNGVDPFQKSADTRGAVFCGSCCRRRIQLAQVSTGRKHGLARAGNNADGSVRRK